MLICETASLRMVSSGSSRTSAGPPGTTGRCRRRSVAQRSEDGMVSLRREGGRGPRCHSSVRPAGQPEQHPRATGDASCAPSPDGPLVALGRCRIASPGRRRRRGARRPPRRGRGGRARRARPAKRKPASRSTWCHTTSRRRMNGTRSAAMSWAHRARARRWRRRARTPSAASSGAKRSRCVADVGGSSAAGRRAPASMSASRASAETYIVPRLAGERRRSTRARSASALRARWESTCPRRPPRHREASAGTSASREPLGRGDEPLGLGGDVLGVDRSMRCMPRLSGGLGERPGPRRRGPGARTPGGSCRPCASSTGRTPRTAARRRWPGRRAGP